MKKYITILLSAVFVGIFTNVGHPVTPYYINEIALPKIVFGYLYAAMSLGMLISAPIWGSIGDSKGRKWVLIVCSIFYGVGQTLFGIFKNPVLIIFARLFSGLFSGGILVSLLSYISRSKDLLRFNTTRTTALFISLQLVGVSIGQFVGGALGNVFNPHYEYVLYAQGIMMLLFALYVLIFMDFSDEEKIGIRSANPFASFKSLKVLTLELVFFFIIIALVNITFTDVSKYLDVYFSDCGYESLKLGTVNLVVGILTLLVNLFLTPILIKKIKPLPSLFIFSLFGGIMLILTFVLPNLLLNIYTFYMLFIAAKAIIEPVIVEYLNQHKDIASGVLMGLRQSFISLGGIIGVIIGGHIYAYNNVLIFYVCAGILIFSGIACLIIQIFNKNKINN